MELAADANILVAGFLRSAITRELLLDERLTLYAPEYGLVETERILTSPRIRRKLGEISISEIKAILTQLTGKIRVSPAKMYAPHLSRAKSLSPDPEDVPYFALALHLRAPLWSNDAALKKQRVISVYTTDELLEIL